MANIAPFIEVLSTIILQPPAFVHNLHTVSEKLVVVDKFDYVVKMKSKTIRQYYITPQGWTSSLEVPQSAFLQLLIGDVIMATYNPLTRTAVGVELIGKVPPGTELSSLAPDFKALEKQNKKTILLTVAITTSLLSLLGVLMTLTALVGGEALGIGLKFIIIPLAIALVCGYLYHQSSSS